MAARIEIPDQPSTVTETLKVTTGRKEAKEKGTKPVEGNFEAILPKDLGSAIALIAQRENLSLELAAKRVHRLFINAYVVELQGEERQKLQPQVEGKGRKKAPYLQSLGL